MQTHELRAACLAAQAAEDWEELLILAKRHIRQMPTEPAGWMYRAQAFSRAGRTVAAIAGLRLAAMAFEDEPQIAEQMAELHEALGQSAQAAQWRSEAAARVGRQLRR